MWVQEIYVLIGREALKDTQCAREWLLWPTNGSLLSIKWVSSWKLESYSSEKSVAHGLQEASVLFSDFDTRKSLELSLLWLTSEQLVFLLFICWSNVAQLHRVCSCGKCYKCKKRGKNVN